MDSEMFDIFETMEIHRIHCGFLSVMAEEMIRPHPAKQISNVYALDRQGQMRLSMNALLVAEGNKVVLMDPGCADFLPSRLVQDYGLEISVSLEEQLAKVGYGVEQITDVIFTHLHFDHGSGAFKRVPGNIVPRFPNAEYHVLKEHFDYAGKPHSSESNSFFTTFLKYVDKTHWLEELNLEWMEFRVFNGHTKGMVVPLIRTPDADTYFLTDLIPMEYFLQSDVCSAYDLNPALAIQEKNEFLGQIKKPSRFIYFHEPLKDSTFYP